MKPRSIFSVVFVAVILLALAQSHGAVLNVPPAVAQQQTHVSISSITIPTYPVDNALIHYTSPIYNMPYTKIDGGKFDKSRVENRTYELIILENSYLQVSILPELGGRIYQTIFKPTGNNIFYQNPVLKPAPWGPPEMGWWMAVGGMEWGLPVEEHGYEWGIPWQYEIVDIPDGVTVNVWDSTAVDRLQTNVAITLRNDASFIEITPTVKNPTNRSIDYKFWLNAMLAPGPTNRVSPNLRIIMPTNQVTVHSAGDSRLPVEWSQAGWPIHNGVDWSLLGNWQQWYGFFQYPQAGGDFQAIYDEGYNEGVVRTYDSRQISGAKFFAFGSGSYAISPDHYTDDDSSYVEIHGGIMPTFAETHRLNASESFSWTERWYPVAGLGSLTWANSHIALHLEDSGDTTRLHVTATQPTENARILLLNRVTGAVLYDVDDLTLEPGQPYHSPQLNIPGLDPAQMSVLVYSGDTLLGAYQHDENTPPPNPQTPAPSTVWQGELVNTGSFSSWVSIVRIWVKGQVDLPVTLTTEDGQWAVTGKVGSKPEYGIDALEFAPVMPGTYIITPQGLGTSFKLQIGAGKIAEVVFEQVAETEPVPTATATPVLATPTDTPFPTPTQSPTLTFTPYPTETQAPTQTPTVTPPLKESSPTVQPSPTLTASSTPVPTFTHTPLPTATATNTLTPTSTQPPSPTATATDTPTPQPGWHVQVDSNQKVSSNWFAVIRASVEGQLNIPVRVWLIANGIPVWSTGCRTGSKPEYGPYFCEISPILPGEYVISADGTDVETRVYVGRGGVAVVVFEKY